MSVKFVDNFSLLVWIAISTGFLIGLTRVARNALCYLFDQNQKMNSRIPTPTWVDQIPRPQETRCVQAMNGVVSGMGFGVGVG